MATSNTPPNCPILKLSPLSPSECALALSLNPREVAADWPIPIEHIQRHCASCTLWLKLCSSKEDIVDVEADNDVGPTFCARSDGQGNYTCQMTMGRTQFINIEWTKVSRALCDIGMTRRLTNDSEEDGSNNNNVTAWIKMRKGEGEHDVHLDGDIIDLPINQLSPLEDGSILSLYGPIGFAYRISIQNNGATVNGSQFPVTELTEDIAENCAICMEQLCSGETCETLPCFHRYHEDCISKWLKLKLTCPMCKHRL